VNLVIPSKAIAGKETNVKEGYADFISISDACYRFLAKKPQSRELGGL
jgi:hypothetical protein